MNPDEHFAFHRNRPLDFPHLEHIGQSVAIADKSFHGEGVVSG
jgi:hypothetical protein